MKLKALLIVLVFTVVGAACGKRVEYVVGQKGDKGDTGEAGEDAAGCTASPIEANVMYPTGGTVVSCGDTQSVITNGINGTDAVLEVIDPCGDAPGIHDEVILHLASGQLLASFSDNANGNNTRFSFLTAGSYQTTDGSHCHFTVDNNGQVH